MSNSSLPRCEIAPETARSDAGVAGAGILLAFIITAGLALLLSSFIVFSEIRGRTSRNISRKILSGLSDQQLVEGIGIQVVGLAKVNSMVPYHFFIIWMLSLLSTATNFAALMALVQDFKRDWVLRWLRQFAMFVNMVLTIVFGIFVLETNIQSLAPTLPMVCVWREHAKSSDGQGNKTLSVIGTIAVIAASAIIFALGTWYLHMKRQYWGKIVRCVSLLVLMAMAIGAAVRVIIISQAFGTPSVNLSDMGEKEWSFGQLLTMLLLLLPFVSALEIFRGQMHVPESSPHDDSDQIPLTSSDGADLKPDNRYTYQSNPFFR
ncbi:hypothetical protein M409DRAFT_49248 [Zasmidium cellare ATCC 36951]|uniref:Uncharacterized protein n=1 Tax=Zasmidium cellare ATCC 36951 TaxID=1080233 RepID=A0A6A6D3K5_ZASCE|nr:uncharacterized protein M409DRAFT_49248 [Zasmidium cellare ATCC 36951]KAF2172709.1 hypothetical protein M409DRAFT_49248 [Zasmidium cellare ATCC 36951]